MMLALAPVAEFSNIYYSRLRRVSPVIVVYIDGANHLRALQVRYPQVDATDELVVDQFYKLGCGCVLAVSLQQ